MAPLHCQEEGGKRGKEKNDLCKIYVVSTALKEPIFNSRALLIPF